MTTRSSTRAGRTMLPGLIDLHAHLMILGHGSYARFFEWLDEQDDITLEQVMEISARQLLSAGVTSAVELGAPTEESLRVRDRIAFRGDPRPATVGERLVGGQASLRRFSGVCPELGEIAGGSFCGGARTR